MKLSLFQIARRKIVFLATVLSTLLPFLLLVLKGQKRCPKDYDSRRGLCTRKIDDFHFRELLVYFEFGLSSGSAMLFLFVVLLDLVKTNHKC